jgi:ATP-dependent Lon protease
MKINYILIFCILCYSCATTSPSSSGKSTQGIAQISPESQARNITEKMKSALDLDQNQYDKALTVNVVNQKIMKRLRESKDTAQMSSTRTKYQEEMKAILTQSQYDIFLKEF